MTISHLFILLYIMLTSRLVVLESRLGLESGLESIFAGLGLGLELKGLGLGLGLGSFFLQVLCQVHLALVT